MTRILERPLDLHQLRTLSKGGRERIAAVVAVPWHDLLTRDQDQLEEDLARRVTGTRYGLADIGVKLVGILGQELLLEVTGDVSLLVEDYDLVMAEEERERTHEHRA